MTDKPKNRGTDPEDEKSFSEPELIKLKKAQEETAWLLGRGYPMIAVITLVGGHHQLTARQRLSVQRSACPVKVCESRKARLLPYGKLSEGPLQIDGFNLIITMEVALSSGIVLLCSDGTMRDLAGLRGTYHPINKTDEALDIIGRAVQKFNIPEIVFWLDSPVSNSGRLKTRIMEHADNWNIPVDVRLVVNPDAMLSGMERIVTSDSVILDNCLSWFNLAPCLIDSYIPNARIINLSNVSKK